VHLDRVDPAIGGACWLTSVYGPTDHALKEAFLNELEGLASSCLGAWLICGDFNLIYQAQDKSNDRLNRRLMQRFRRTIDTLQLAELHLNGRLYTWSNERNSPTLERIDRVFATVQWLEDHPFHRLHCRSTDCSDHAHCSLCSARNLGHNHDSVLSLSGHRWMDFWTWSPTLGHALSMWTRAGLWIKGCAM
jgi:hypothetical protein